MNNKEEVNQNKAKLQREFIQAAINELIDCLPSQKYIASFVGVSEAAVSQWKSNKVSSKNLYKLYLCASYLPSKSEKLEKAILKFSAAMDLTLFSQNNDLAKDESKVGHVVRKESITRNNKIGHHLPFAIYVAMMMYVGRMIDNALKYLNSGKKITDIVNRFNEMDGELFTLSNLHVDDKGTIVKRILNPKISKGVEADTNKNKELVGLIIGSK
jgi:predicted transcriptional regulator